MPSRSFCLLYIRRVVIALLVSFAIPAAAATPRSFHGLSEKEIDSELRAIHTATPDLKDRVGAVSERFLGIPYKLGPMGEGPKGEFDRDPDHSFERLDCTTFVEETMALSLRPRLPEALKTLQKIRYKDGKVAFQSRNHFTSVDWNPRNEEAGYLRDVTREVAGDKTVVLTKTIKKRDWYAAMSTDAFKGSFTDVERLARLPKLRAAGEKMADETATLPVLPLSELPAALPRIPSGTLANLVRADDPTKPDLVSHQFLFVRKDGALFVRHAAYGKEVQDVPALEYFYRYWNSKWPVVGVNLLELRDPGR